MIGCAGTMPPYTNSERQITYDFIVEGKSQTELWHLALLFFTENYVDSSLDFSVMNVRNGVLIGRGSVPWKYSVYAPICIIEYHIRFAAKDEQARLQFELIEGVPPGSPCTAWPWPTEDGYSQVVSYLNDAAQKLDAALKGVIPAPRLE